LPIKLKVKRSREPLKISLLTNNSISIDTLLIPKVGDLFSAGNIPTIPLLGAGYWIDLTNDKRFAYPRNIFINTIDDLDEVDYKTSRYIAKHQITDENEKAEIYDKFKKLKAKDYDFKQSVEKLHNYRFNLVAGRVRFNLIMPSIYQNGISTKNPEVKSFKTQGVGFNLGFGLDYFYNTNHFLTYESSLKTSSWAFWSIPDINPKKIDFTLRNGFRKNRMEYSLGLSFNYVDYTYKIPDENLGSIRPFFSDDDKTEFRENYRTLGFSTLVSYQLTSALFIGFRYDPTVLSFRNIGNQLNYEHVFGLDLRFKF